MAQVFEVEVILVGAVARWGIVAQAGFAALAVLELFDQHIFWLRGIREILSGVCWVEVFVRVFAGQWIVAVNGWRHLRLSLVGLM